MDKASFSNIPECVCRKGLNSLRKGRNKEEVKLLQTIIKVGVKKKESKHRKCQIGSDAQGETFKIKQEIR